MAKTQVSALTVTCRHCEDIADDYRGTKTQSEQSAGQREDAHDHDRESS